MNIEGTVALVTGGANDIGRAIASKLAEERADTIIIHYRSSQDDADETAAMVRKIGAKSVVVRADISRDADVRKMFDDIARQHGRLDILVNNAATRAAADYADLEALSDETWNDLFRVNVLGPFYCARAAAPMLRRAHGAIINLTSIAGYRAVGSSLHYGVSKAALLQLTRGLARALAPEVRVNSVSPGTVDGRWHRGQQGANFASWSASEIARMPLGRLVRPEDVAQAVVGLINDDIVTGQDIIADAGRHLLY